MSQSNLFIKSSLFLIMALSVFSCSVQPSPVSSDTGQGKDQNSILNEAAAGTSTWVYVGTDGKLNYTLLNKARIMDFSRAGFSGGGVALPNVPTVMTLSPNSGDNTAAIQSALDKIASLPADAHGMRGALQLSAGTFNITGTLTIKASGVVLRGSGNQANGTIIKAGSTPITFLKTTSAVNYQLSGSPVPILKNFVPNGSTSIPVSSTAGFSVGDWIAINIPITAEWIHLMGMDTLVRNGAAQTWIKPGNWYCYRQISAIGNGVLMIDTPLSRPIDPAYTSGTVSHVSLNGFLYNIGIENLSAEGAPNNQPISSAQYQFLVLNGVINGWVKNVAVKNCANTVNIDGGSRQITVKKVSSIRTYLPNSGAGYATDFSIGNGVQVLFINCSVNGTDGFAFVTQSGVDGPNVLLNCTATGNGSYMPHQRWATGLLLDGINAPNGDISFMNRGTMGSGQGWTIGYAVAWNCNTKSLRVDLPPGSANWAIGCIAGTVNSPLPKGYFESLNSHVSINSLYLAQLSERLGPQAVNAVTNDNNTDTAGPAGYTFCANEDQSYTFNQIVDLAYGANGKFNYTNSVTGTILFNNATFGDPITGIAKKGYYKVSSKPVVTIPAKIEAENYVNMAGIQTEACAEGTLDVGWIDTGDWFEYNINVQTAGSYIVEYRVASQFATGKVALIVGGTTLASTDIPNTSAWQNWTTVSTTISLTAGQKVLRLSASGGAWNINWFNVKAAAASSSSAIQSSSKSSAASSSGTASSSGVNYTVVTAPFSFDGAGTYHWKIANIPAYVNNWSTASVKINGMDVTGLYKSPDQLPAKQGGYYYIDYTGSVSWSHFEVK